MSHATGERPAAEDGTSLAAVLRSWTPAPDAGLLQLLDGADDWAIHPETASLLDFLIHVRRPRSVLEFGAGRSSLVIARALAGIGGGQLTSIEHQPDFARASWQRITQFPSVDATLVPSRLALRLSRCGVMHTFIDTQSELRDRGPFELIFIDAPPGQLGRDATLFTASPYLAPGAIALLDDAARQAEKTALSRWRRGLRTTTVLHSDHVGRGVSVVEVPSPGAARFSLRTFLGTMHDRLTNQ